ncbi:hypothetical protein pb186bvf_014684 [Paramecium bursaria]
MFRQIKANKDTSHRINQNLKKYKHINKRIGIQQIILYVKFWRGRILYYCMLSGCGYFVYSTGKRLYNYQDHYKIKLILMSGISILISVYAFKAFQGLPQFIQAMDLKKCGTKLRITTLNRLALVNQFELDIQHIQKPHDVSKSIHELNHVFPILLKGQLNSPSCPKCQVHFN